MFGARPKNLTELVFAGRIFLLSCLREDFSLRGAPGASMISSDFWVAQRGPATPHSHFNGNFQKQVFTVRSPSRHFSIVCDIFADEASQFKLSRRER